MAIRKLSLPLPVTQTQEPAETALAMMENLCRGTQDRVADICKFRVECGNREAELLMMPGEWGMEIHVSLLVFHH